MQYAFQYTDVVKCPPFTPNTSPLAPVTVVIPANGTALNVLEQSVGISTYYRFTATYFGPVLGYFINEGTAGNDKCTWSFYYQLPGSPGQVPSKVGVSNFRIPSDSYSIFMRYQTFQSGQGVHLNLNQLSAWVAIKCGVFLRGQPLLPMNASIRVQLY